ncbi:hypothetical protein M1437_01765 [Patescibacteria group bacterium]|nr:hypothetical protein [Patescibacteria group bacterium]
MSKKQRVLSINTKVQIITLIVSLLSVFLSILNFLYTNYKSNKDNRTRLLLICNIPSNSIGYGTSQLNYLNFDVICRVTNISLKKISIDKIESGNTDDNEKSFNSDEAQGIIYSSSEKAEFPKLLDINQQERYLIQVKLPLYGNKSAQKCLNTGRQEVNLFAKCFMDNNFSVDTFTNNIEVLPNLAVRVITADQEKFITKISLKNSFYFYNKEENKWTYDLSNSTETWSYPKQVNE